MKSSIPCAVCGTEQVEIVASEDRDGHPLQSVICTHCGLVWVDPRPSADAVREFYAADYRAAYKGAAEPKRKHCYRETWRARERAQRFLEVYRPGMRVLDIGAGAGFFLYVLRRLGVEGSGIEPNDGYARFAIDRLGLDGVQVGFLDDIPADGRFDLVTINHVFEHLDDPRGAMRRLAQLISAEGRIIMEVPNIEATYHAPGHVFHIGHLYWYNPINIAALARDCGLVVDELRIVPGVEHINLVLRHAGADDPPSATAELTANYARVQHVLRRHTALRHYLSPTPYVRAFGKLVRSLQEQRHIAGHNDGVAIVRAAVADLAPSTDVAS